MKEWLIKVLGDNIGGPTIGLFNGWHIFYIILIFGSCFLAAYLLKNKQERTKKIVVNTMIILAVISYILDFFIMPLGGRSLGAILDKLPFHICTSISIIACFAQFNKHFRWIKTPAVVLCIVAPLMYMTYPGSALNGDPSAFSYRVFQTFIYHGLVFAYGFLSLTTKEVELNIKNIWKELVVIIGIAIWASIGNALYLDYDWFFLKGNAFPFVPKWLMPFVVVVCVYGMCALIYGIYYLVKYISKKCNAKKQLAIVNNANEISEAEDNVVKNDVVEDKKDESLIKEKSKKKSSKKDE